MKGLGIKPTSAALRKRRCVPSGASRTALFDLDKLAADSHHAAFNDYSSETLEEMWAYKTEDNHRLKLGAGVGWSEPDRWIVPTRWSLGAKERP